MARGSGGCAPTDTATWDNEANMRLSYRRLARGAVRPGRCAACDASQQDTGIRRRPVLHTVSVLASAGVAVRITYT